MKRIVVYYSYTGNTEKIANHIKEKLACDILELTPWRERLTYATLIFYRKYKGYTDKIIL